MKAVHKCAVKLEEIRDVLELDLPTGATIISVGNQRECLAVWYVCDENEKGRELHTLRCAGTGHPLNVGVPASDKNFLGTVQFRGGEFVLHIFGQ